MDPNESQRFKILLILLAVLAATLWIGRGIYRVPEARQGSLPDSSSPQGEASRPAALPLENENLARRTPSERVRGRNPFQYAPEPMAVVETAPARVIAADVGERAVDLAPPPPPAPPPIPFRYTGYARVGPTEEVMALLVNDGASFTVSEEDVIMGRYRINTLSETFVEIEDLEYGQSQRLGLVIE